MNHNSIKIETKNFSLWYRGFKSNLKIKQQICREKIKVISKSSKSLIKNLKIPNQICPNYKKSKKDN